MDTKITRREFSKTCTLATMGLIAGCSVRNQFNVIIRNGIIIDGTGSKAIKKDLGIKGDKITAIDDLSSATADLIIDAKDMVISPGFIDIHSHSDVRLLYYSNAESKIHQGVTTEVTGNCGYSAFPLNDNDFKKLDEDITEQYDVHVTWKNIAGYHQALNNKKIALNYATFTGQGTLRSCVVGKNNIPATPEQMTKMKDLLASSMENGSLGLSTGLEYAPGSYASTEELIELCKVVSRYNGVYATHMRNEDDHVEDAVNEAIRICREANVSLQISHFKACNKVNWHRLDNILKMIHDAADSGLPVNADRYPYTAYSTGLTIFLPLWARQGSKEEALARLKDTQLLPKIKEYIERKALRIGGWDRIVICSCFTENNKKWEGRSILECAETAGMSPFEFTKDLLITEKNRVNIIGFAMSDENLQKVLSSPLVMIGSDGSSVAPHGISKDGKVHPRFYGTFPRVIGKFCREEKYFDLATAIKKMTSMPARKLNLSNRGIIAKNNYADVVIFNPNTIIDNATFQEPHQFPTGINYVIVNGKLTIKNGKHTGERAGSVIKSGV